MKRKRTASKPTLLLLEALLAQPNAARYGYELIKSTSIASGTLYPILMRLEERGFLSAEWREPAEQGRPPRHAYMLTPDGIAYAANEIDMAKTKMTKIKASRTQKKAQI